MGVLGEFVEHQNNGRARRALNLRVPLDEPIVLPFRVSRIARKPVLGDLVSAYEAGA